MSWAYYSDPDRSRDGDFSEGVIVETVERKPDVENRRVEREQLILPGFERLLPLVRRRNREAMHV